MADRDDTVKRLREVAAFSRRDMIAAQLVAAHFRPDFEAAMRAENGEAVKLYPYVIEREREAKRWGEEADIFEQAADEIEELRAALRTFTEADWYVAGHGNFEAKLPGDVITAAKAALPPPPTQDPN